MSSNLTGRTTLGNLPATHEMVALMGVRQVTGMSENRRTAPIVAVALGALLLLTGCGNGSSSGSSSASESAELHSIGTPLDSSVPARIRDLSFTASDGTTHTLADFAGKTVVISDIMTLCQETCPMDTAGVVQTARQQNAAGHEGSTVYLSITVDPARDATSQIAAYRGLYRPAPANWQVWTGSSRNVNALWDYLGVWAKKVADDDPAPKNWRTGTTLTYDVQHSDEVFVLDRHQHERFVLEGMPYVKGDTVPASLQKFLSAEGRKNLSANSSTDWTPAQAEKVLDWVRD